MITLDFETIDEDGYPTEELLDYIESYDSVKGSPLELIKLVYDYWSYDYPYRSYTRVGENYIVDLATGGWSGNESLIYALQANQLFWLQTWFYSQRGGKYQFHVKHFGKEWEDL